MSHSPIANPSPWVVQHAKRLPKGAKVLDLACGTGRHLCYLSALGHWVTGIDHDVSKCPCVGEALHQVNLEDGSPLPEMGPFDAVIVTNYLHRPLSGQIMDWLKPGGLLIYETFGLGNEQFGRPSNPDFLLKPGELLEMFKPLRIIAFEEGILDQKVVSRLVAQKGDALPVLTGP